MARRLLSSLALLAVAGITAGTVLAWHQGYRIYVVHTGSMIPTLRPGEAVVDRPFHGRPRRGEIITFRYPSGPDTVVTHRVFSESGGAFRTKGDANPTADPWRVRTAQVVGVPAAIIPDGGYVVVYLSQPTGAASVVVFTIMIALLWGLCFPGAPDDAGRQSRPPRPYHPRHRAADAGGPATVPLRALSPVPGIDW
jgi:signal peptidase I